MKSKFNYKKDLTDQLPESLAVKIKTVEFTLCSALVVESEKLSVGEQISLQMTLQQYQTGNHPKRVDYIVLNEIDL